MDSVGDLGLMLEKPELQVFRTWGQCIVCREQTVAAKSHRKKEASYFRSNPNEASDRGVPLLMKTHTLQVCIQGRSLITAQAATIQSHRAKPRI